MKVSTRLIILVGSAVVALATLGGLGLHTLHRALMNDREARITNMLVMGEHLVAHYYDEEKQGRLTEQQAQAAAKAALTQRSATAASEIKGLIGASVSEVGNGSRLVGQAGAAMDAIVGEISRVSTIIGEISNASTEQTQGIDQINQAIMGMDDVTQQNAALVEEAAASAQSLQELSRELAELVAVFRLEKQPRARARAADLLT